MAKTEGGEAIKYGPVPSAPVRTCVVAIAVEDIQVTRCDDPVPLLLPDEHGEIGDEPVGGCISVDPCASCGDVWDFPSRVHADERERLRIRCRDRRRGQGAKSRDRELPAYRVYDRFRFMPPRLNSRIELHDRCPPIAFGAATFRTPWLEIRLRPRGHLSRRLGRFL